jgi:hypothetical protein
LPAKASHFLGRYDRRAALVDQLFTNGAEATVFRPVFEIQRQAPPPVGMLVVAAAGQIGLLDGAENVLGLDDQQLCRGSRQKGVDGDHEVLRDFGNREGVHAGALGQQSACFSAIRKRARSWARSTTMWSNCASSGNKLQRRAGVDVVALPEALQGR